MEAQLEERKERLERQQRARKRRVGRATRSALSLNHASREEFERPREPPQVIDDRGIGPSHHRRNAHRSRANRFPSRENPVHSGGIGGGPTSEREAHPHSSPSMNHPRQIRVDVDLTQDSPIPERRHRHHPSHHHPPRHYPSRRRRNQSSSRGSSESAMSAAASASSPGPSSGPPPNHHYPPRRHAHRPRNSRNSSSSSSSSVSSSHHRYNRKNRDRNHHHHRRPRNDDRYRDVRDTGSMRVDRPPFSGMRRMDPVMTTTSDEDHQSSAVPNQIVSDEQYARQLQAELDREERDARRRRGRGSSAPSGSHFHHRHDYHGHGGHHPFCNSVDASVMDHEDLHRIAMHAHRTIHDSMVSGHSSMDFFDMDEPGFGPGREERERINDDLVSVMHFLQLSGRRRARLRHGENRGDGPFGPFMGPVPLPLRQLMGVFPDIDSMSHEELLQMFPTTNRGASASAISRLPTDTFKVKDDDVPMDLDERGGGSSSKTKKKKKKKSGKEEESSSSSESDTSETKKRSDKAKKVSEENERLKNQCCICLEQFQEGDSIKRLPCFHIFHADEVDKWLSINFKCPICRHPIEE